MDPRLTQLANAFYGAAAVLGIPSLVGSVIFGYTAIRIRSSHSRQVQATPIPRNSDAVVLIILSAAKAIGGAASLIGRLGGGILKLLAVTSICVLFFASLLYLTALGLHAGREWARWVGILVMTPPMLVSTIGLLSRGSGFVRLASSAVAALSGYAIFLLWSAFGEVL